MDFLEVMDIRNVKVGIFLNDGMAPISPLYGVVVFPHEIIIFIAVAISGILVRVVAMRRDLLDILVVGVSVVTISITSVVGTILPKVEPLSGCVHATTQTDVGMKDFELVAIDLVVFKAEEQDFLTIAFKNVRANPPSHVAISAIVGAMVVKTGPLIRFIKVASIT